MRVCVVSCRAVKKGCFDRVIQLGRRILMREWFFGVKIKLGFRKTCEETMIDSERTDAIWDHLSFKFMLLG